MTATKVDRIVEAAKRASAAHGQMLFAQHMAWKERQSFFPSTTPGSRGFVSPLGGQAVPARLPIALSHVEPKKGSWW